MANAQIFYMAWKNECIELDIYVLLVEFETWNFVPQPELYHLQLLLYHVKNEYQPYSE